MEWDRLRDAEVAVFALVSDRRHTWLAAGGGVDCGVKGRSVLPFIHTDRHSSLFISWIRLVKSPRKTACKGEVKPGRWWREASVCHIQTAVFGQQLQLEAFWGRFGFQPEHVVYWEKPFVSHFCSFFNMKIPPSSAKSASAASTLVTLVAAIVYNSR